MLDIAGFESFEHNSLEHSSSKSESLSMKTREVGNPHPIFERHKYHITRLGSYFSGLRRSSYCIQTSTRRASNRLRVPAACARQLFINLSNELLQKHFNEYFFRMELEALCLYGRTFATKRLNIGMLHFSPLTFSYGLT